MRLATFRVKGSRIARPGLVVGDRIHDLTALARAGAVAPKRPARILKAAIERWDEWRPFLADAARRAPAGGTPLAAVELLPPIPDPGKFLCVGKNNRTHLEELKRNALIREIPNEPTGFIKVNDCLVGDRARVARPPGVTTMDYEPELVFVLGRRAHGVARAEALDYVAGVTLFNDLTAREVQQREVETGTRFWTAKNMPGFGPVGPWLVTLDEIGDPNALELVCRVNGAERIRYRIADQRFDFGAALAHFSRYVPFEPGDLISMGAPSGSAIGQPDPSAFYLKPGDTVEVACDRIGTLTNRVVAGRTPRHARGANGAASAT
jgi:2-keto-4-pentenoate hydratase/2-oxohepta-3-ene-1,7-dioic acid hydratase in catechol pathway